MSDYIWFVDFKININLMRKASKLFVRKANFLSFSTSEVEDTIREINKISISKDSSGIIKIVCEGNGFLRSMVRMIVANLVFISCNKTNMEWIEEKINNPKKGSSIHKAPGGGLYLSKVYY
jgi:tRNA pseudouridine38-40 synthase